MTRKRMRRTKVPGIRKRKRTIDLEASSLMRPKWTMRFDNTIFNTHSYYCRLDEILILLK
jgi:uncharacterized protein YjlB